MKKYFLLVFTLFLVSNINAQVAVIANKSVSETTIKTSKVSDIYTLRNKSWTNGNAITVFTLKSEDAVVDKFYSSFEKSSSDMKKLWMKLQLTGEGMAPEALNSSDEMISKVASTTGAIGFIDAKKVNDKVKVLLTIN